MQLDQPTIIAIGGSLLAAVVIGFGILALIAKFYRKVDQGRALIVNKLKVEPIVTFTGTTVVPIFHRAEEMDISVKTIEIDRRGTDGLLCKDNVRADIKVAFFVRVNKTQEDVLKVAQSIGCARASDVKHLEELFAAKFSEALKTVGKRLDFEDLYKERESFRDQIIEVIGKDLNGFVLEDAAIDYLEQTPLEHLDPQNILDAQGIRKITELTAQQAVLTNDFKQNEKKAITKQNVEAQEAILELERRQAESQAKQHREIAISQAREHAETLRVQADERRKAELARIKTDEDLAIAEQNKIRGAELSELARRRALSVETERATKERDLELIAREREVELQRIEKEKNIEVEKKAIADVIRTRISVEKTVAEEEERIKDLRAVAEASRNKDVVRINAEAEAQQNLVKMLKAAEAQEEAAKFAARQKIIEADAALDASDKQAKAKIRLADGVKAEAAAKGLAEAQVREVTAAAIEKEGLAQAKVYLEQSQAEAQGEERKGLALVRVREADAAAIEKQGLAEAAAIRERMLAEATGQESQGLAKVRIAEGEAQVVEKRGQAEAVTIREKLIAEAAGLAEKAAAMKALEGVGKEHEEFRIRLEAEKSIQLERIHASRDIAQAQAQVLAQALADAKIQIVGGDGQFFDRFMKAVSVGQSIDGFVGHSDIAQQILKPYLSGDGSLPEDLKQILSRPALSPEGLQNLTVSALLARLLQDKGASSKVESVLEAVKDIGTPKAPAE